MLDRESTFAVPETVALLKQDFVPVALDQAYQRRQKDTEGEFYRKIAGQSPRNDFNNTTQGFYVADAAGKLLLYNNNRDPQKLLRLIRKSLDEFSTAVPEEAQVILPESKDPRWNLSPPEGGLVVRVQAKILDGYEETADRWRNLFQCAVSRDNLWVTKVEHQALLSGEFPKSLQKRIARFHLVDNTRGEPPMWQTTDIRDLKFAIDGEGQVTGKAHLQTRDGERGYQAEVRGQIVASEEAVTKFELVVLGDFWGEGRFTRGAPKGRFPLAIAFTLADGSDIADRIPPQGARGWIDGYLR